jgi:hypothetical protein
MAPVSTLVNKGKRKYINKGEAVKVMHTSAGEPIGCLQPCFTNPRLCPLFFQNASTAIDWGKGAGLPTF